MLHSKNQRWTEAEIDLIFDNLNKPWLELLPLFPNRNPKSVKNKSWELGRKTRLGVSTKKFSDAVKLEYCLPLDCGYSVEVSGTLHLGR